MNELCPLCLSSDSNNFWHSEDRDYLHCLVCDLVFVPKASLPSLKTEKIKYDQHQNSPSNKGYREFLNRLLKPMKEYISCESKGLDFGSGPGPTLSKMLQEDGYDIDIYDYFYANDPAIFEKKYNFITTTEVIEHLHDVDMEIARLWSMLVKGGVLGIMTAFRPDDDKFDSWYYKRDLTHVRFFSPSSFEYLAKKLEGEIVFIDNGVVIVKKC
ncbi:MAG TPA: class I SAM-dependent methyltransferase [Campylobacterales bacterium]|nr:class I SAM-dependent methyltransferase [Campylobacterales bacterium]